MNRTFFFFYDFCPSYGWKYLLPLVLQVLKFPVRFSRIGGENLKTVRNEIKERRNEKL